MTNIMKWKIYFKTWLPLMLILTGIFLIYIPILKGTFLNWDDDSYLLENPLVRSLSIENTKRIFSHTILDHYCPFTILTYSLEYHFAGLNPFIYHLNNVLLHLGVTGLIFLLSIQIGLSRRAAALAALLFGIHPMHVESVAWVSERKDVLYSLFYMGAITSYCEYMRRKRISWYTLSVMLGLLSMLAKGMALTLPLIFFLCDWINARKFDRSAIFDKIPHFLYIIPLTWFIYSMNKIIPLKSNLEGVLLQIWCFSFYLRKFFFPVNLVPMYQIPRPITIQNFSYLGAIAIFLFVVYLGVSSFRNKNRWTLFAILYFICSIFFLLRLNDNFGPSAVADRFMYLPSLGICIWMGIMGEKFLNTLAARGKILRVLAHLGVASLFLFLASATFF